MQGGSALTASHRDVPHPRLTGKDAPPFCGDTGKAPHKIQPPFMVKTLQTRKEGDSAEPFREHRPHWRKPRCFPTHFRRRSSEAASALLIHSATEGHLGCLQVLAIMNKSFVCRFCMDTSFQLLHPGQNTVASSWLAATSDPWALSDPP